MSFGHSPFQPIYGLDFHFWLTGTGNNSASLHSVELLRNNWHCNGVLQRADEHIPCCHFESSSSSFLNGEELPIWQTRFLRSQLQFRRHTQYFSHHHLSSQNPKVSERLPFPKGPSGSKHFSFKKVRENVLPT